ncbi:glycosyltransferase family 2 protein [uncultured Devosia sp.]|uniref:glycosyltransferase family 2 protein n=1 Tax=uncultured Devosia sp. TaxID=211434 RepID=UPI0035CB8104
MSETIAVITPAYKAEDTIIATVRSVLAQTYPHWQLVIVSDDGTDYAAFLAGHGIVDGRIGQLSSGRIGGGASAARNVALEQLDSAYAAILDADDRLKPQKLERVAAALAQYGIVSTALDVMDEGFAHLRDIAAGPDRALGPGEHKWVNLSMDSMIAWDRAKADGRYDLTMSNMTDLEFLLQLYRTVPASFHLGTPLHDYVKRAGSMSNGAKTTAGMIASKTTLLERLERGHYRLAPGGVEGMAGFLRVSLQAERDFFAALRQNSRALFEDHLEPRLALENRAQRKIIIQIND